MKKLYSFLGAALIAMHPAISYGQAGSVSLWTGSGAVLSTHATVQAAYNAIPATLTQSYRIEVDQSYTGASEVPPIIFSDKAGAGPANTITVGVNLSAALQYAHFEWHTDSSSLFVLDGADWVVFDGYRPPPFPHGMSFFVRKTKPFGTGTTEVPFHEAFPLISFINGAKHNTISHCQFTANSTDSGYVSQPLVLFGGTNNGLGNDSNTIVNCNLSWSHNGIASRGNSLFPNKGLAIRNNTIGAEDKGVEVGSGTSGIHIDSNAFRNGGVANIALYHLADSNTVYRNSFAYDDNSDAETIGIQLAPAAGSAANSHCLVAENTFFYTDHHASTGGYKSAIFLYESWRSPYALTGIDLGGTGPIRATIAHNSARFSHKIFQPTAITHPAKTVLLRYNNSNAGNNIQVLNNLWINDLSFGTAGSEHLALQLSTTAGYYSDYNTYGKGARMKIGASTYASYPAYRVAHNNLDVHSNDSTVMFDDVISVLLLAQQYQNPYLQGTPVTLVPFDAIGNPHAYPMRGAFEITPDCGSGAFGGQIGTGKIPCPGVDGQLSYYDPNYRTGVIHQWQQSQNNGLTYTDIPGENGRKLMINVVNTTVYRVKDSCVGGSGLVRYSNNYSVVPWPTGGIGILTETHGGFTYEFKVSRYTTPKLAWDFGDLSGGTFPADTVISHTYASKGFYTVRVSSRDGCTDSMTSLFIEVSPLSISKNGQQLPGISVYPNPASTILHIEGGAGCAVSVQSVVGQTLMSETLQKGKEVISIAHLPAGTYLLRVQSATGTSTVRFLKQ